ncbi:MAG TPA: SRPBCC domain-containing protein, partial [Longimicrobiales bacterium]|nr:SRPBCC domain-containing protein [Longimicrobiales bacterium]
GEGGGRDGRDGREKVFVPHINGCFLDVVPRERIVFTDALTAGWRPAANGFVTAVMTFRDHPDGTEYVARAMHKDPADRERHVELGFYDGWTTVIEQLAVLVEGERV